MGTSSPHESVPGSLTGKDLLQLVGFNVGGQDYAFRIEQIQEIVILGQVTRLPQVPPYVEGVANLRGSIIPIFNLRLLLGSDPKPSDGKTRTIVVNVGSRILGCVVDSVSQVMRISGEAIQPAPETIKMGGASYVDGFARIGDQLLIVLNVDALLDPDRLDALSSSAIPDAPMEG